MFWQKVHHHLSFFFLAILVLAQGLIFVASKASPSLSYDFKAVLINPLAQSSHSLGEQISLQFKFDQKEIDNRAVVYLVVASPEKNIRLNFEASRKADGSWQANSLWDTKNWPAGIYQLSAVANIFDKNANLVKTLYSDINIIQLIDLSFSKPAVSIEEKEELNPPLAPATDNSQRLVQNQVVNEDGLVIEEELNAINLVDNNSVTTSTTTSTATSTATSTPSAPPIERRISLIVPAPNSTISKAQLSLKLTTNFVANGLSIELINSDSAAISTGSLSIDKVDGLNWNKTINLDDTFIAGSYKLLVTAEVPGSETLLENTFDLTLALPTTLDPADVVLTLANPGSNLSGPVTVKVTSNKNLDNLKFIFQDSVEKKSVLSVEGVLQSSTAGGGQQYIYLLDTNQLINGNYYLLAQSLVGDTLVSSESKIISVYNQGVGVSTSTEPVASSTEDLAEPSTIENPPVVTDKINCANSGITDQQLCARYQAEITGQIPNYCLDQNIFTAPECEVYLRDNTLKNICQSQGITDIGQCQDYLAGQYLAKVDCQSMPLETCQDVLRNQYLYRLSLAERDSGQVKVLATAKAGQTLTIKDLLTELSVSQESAWQLPLLKLETNVFVGEASANTILADAEQLVLNNPAVLLLDRDADALPDDLEAYYGTDSANPDSDGDGYLDGAEVKNAYNPAGSGALVQVRTALDQALFAKLPLEQPHEASLLVDPIWELKQADTNTNGLTLSGLADPDTWVNIYLYSSLPLVLSAKTDSNGTWNYKLDQTLTEGLHKVYIASNDSNGKLLKQSNAISFVVTNVTKEPAPTTNSPAPETVATKKFWEKLPFNIYYVAGAFFLLIFILGIVLLLRRSRRIAEQAMIENSQPIDGQNNNPQV